MASYQDLLDAIARVRAATGTPDAWMAGLSGADLAVVTNPVNVTAPGVVDAVLAKIRAQHRDVFGEAPEPQQGSAADAIRAAETSLAQQNSLSAQVDLQVITAVLNAHSTHDTGRDSLDALQDEIEAAVTTRTDLDTPAGARAFQRYLIDKLRDIRTVVETAGLDATSKASLAAALASLYSAATPTAEPEPETRTPPMTVEPVRDAAPPAPSPAPPPPPVPADPIDDALLDPLLAEDPGPQTPGPAAASPPMAAPMIPSAPAMPAFGGGGGLPGGSGAGLAPAAEPLLAGRRDAPDITPAEDLLPEEDPLDLPADEEPVDETAGDADTEPAAATADPTLVHLPDGDTVTAPSPQLAAAITAAVAGTPIPEAFRAQGITLPAPGTPVASPVDPARLQPGDIGMLTDRHAVALGNGKALFNNRIEPIASVTGPSFLGWEHPPEPGPGDPPAKSDRPTPTRPAVTAGPS